MSAFDPHGFWIAKSNGSQARNFKSIHMPKLLPDATIEQKVITYTMDEGTNHPGYRVYDVRKLDKSYYDFAIDIGMVSPTDQIWFDGLRRNEYTVLISWEIGIHYLAVIKSMKIEQYSLNNRQFGKVSMEFHIKSEVATAFTLV